MAGRPIDNVRDYERANANEWERDSVSDTHESDLIPISDSANSSSAKLEVHSARQPSKENNLIDIYEESIEESETLARSKDAVELGLTIAGSYRNQDLEGLSEAFLITSAPGKIETENLKIEEFAKQQLKKQQSKTEQVKMERLETGSTHDSSGIICGPQASTHTPEHQILGPGLRSNPKFEHFPNNKSKHMASKVSSSTRYRKNNSSTMNQKSYWADPDLLASAKETNSKIAKETIMKEGAQFLSLSKKSAEITGIVRLYASAPYPNPTYHLWPNDFDQGYYLWSETTDAPSLLGPHLEDLNQVRLTCHVFIELDIKKRFLEISSLSTSRLTTDIVNAISAIRQAIGTSKVAYKRSTPIYIVVPPPSKVYKQKVEPVFVEGSTVIRGLVLSGDGLSRHEIAKYDSERDQQLRDNVRLLRDHLMKQVYSLSSLRNWMRMRINFGHLRLVNATKDLLAKKLNVNDVRAMMSSHRFRGEFDKKIGDAQIAGTAINNILKHDMIFSLVSLGDSTQYKRRHTEVIFIKTPDGQRHRIEAGIDVICDWDETTRAKVDDMELTFQIGEVKLFNDDKRNKVLEVSTFDFQNELQWNLDVVTDSSITDIPQAVNDLIQSSITLQTKARRDEMDEIYPAVAPKETLARGIEVEAVVLKTVSVFPLKGSSFIVEVTIYRKWSGCNTRPEPETSCAISMRNYRWDSAMESVEDTLQERDWDQELEDFFPTGHAGGDGFVDLVDQIQHIRHILTAKSSFNKHQSLESTLMSH